MRRHCQTIAILFASFVVLFTLPFGCGKSDSAKGQFEAGKEAYEDQHYAEARDHLLEAVKISPSDKDALYYLGLCYQHDFMYDSALFYLRRADLLHPGDKAINEHIVAVAEALGEPRMAIDAMYTLAKSGEGYEKYYGKLATMSDMEHSPSNTLHWGRLALEYEPDSLQWYYLTAQAAARCDSFALAVNISDRALKRFGYNPLIAAQKGNYLMGLGEYAESERVLEDVVAKDSTGRVEYRLSYAAALGAQDDLAKKRKALEIYRELEPIAPREFAVDSLMSALDSAIRQK